MKNNRVLVAGASGMVGRAVAAELASRGWTVHPHAFSQGIGNVPGIPCGWVRGDLRAREVVRRLVNGCETVVMAAAVTGGRGQQLHEPWRQVNDNLFMGALVLEEAARAGVSRLVLIGSATSYQPFTGKIRENQMDWNQEPPDSYLGIGWVSRYLEKAALFWHKKCGLQVLFVRAANVFGPFAKFDPAVSNFIPAFIRKTAERLDPLRLHGSPEVVRDVIFSADFARALVRLMEAPGSGYEIYNIGSGTGVRVGEVADFLVSRNRDYRPKIEYQNDSGTAQDAFSRVLDITKLEAVIGPISADWQKGVEETRIWWEGNFLTWTK